MSGLYKINYLFTGIISLLLSVILAYSSEIMFGINLAKEFYFYVIFIFVICCSFLCLFLKRKIQIYVNLLDVIVLCFYFWCLIRRPFYSFTDAESIKVIAFLFLYFIIKTFANNHLKKGDVSSKRSVSIIVISFFVIAIVEIISGLLQLYGVLSSFNNNFYITGTTSNPAIFSMFLATVYPVALSWYLLISRKSRDKFAKLANFLAFLVLLMTLSIIPITMIRSAWIGIIGSSIVVLYYCNAKIVRVLKTILNNKRKLYVIIVCIPLLALALLYLYNMKSQSAFGRLLIWEITLNEVKEKPIVGIGYKQYRVEYNNWQAKYFFEKSRKPEKELVADNVEFAYNEYLQILTETGVIGLLLFLLIIYYFVKKILHILKLYEKAAKRGSVAFVLLISAFSCSISILLMALVSYPLQILPIEILFVICLSIFSSNLDSCKSAVNRSLNFKNVFFIKIVLAFFLISIAIMTFFQIYKIPFYIKWKEATVQYNKKEYSASVAIYKDIYSNMSENGLFLLYYGTTLIANNNYKEGVQILEDAKKRISDPIIYIKIGDYKRKLKAYKEAEANYLFASSMIPNRIYPKYLLALLFDESGQYEKAHEYAKEIVEMKAKITSTAVFEMKKTMADLIRKYE